MSKATKHKASQREAPLSKAAPGHEDDLIVVPKGRSRLVFYFTLGIMLFVLFIFTVGDAVMRSCAGRGETGQEVFMRWRTPNGGAHEMSQVDFMLQKRRLSRLRGGTAPEDQEAASWILLDELAREAGVAVTDTELGDWLLKAFKGDTDQYRRYLSSIGEASQAFESAARQDLRVRRYMSLVLSAAQPVDPDLVEKRWKGRHQEYLFEYIDLPTEDVLAQARTEVPSDEELKTWFDGLLDYRKKQFTRPAQVSGEVIVLALDKAPEELTASAAKLLERYPQQIDDPEAAAREYHQGFGYVRFKRETPDLSQGFTGLMKPFEEVREEALAEAPIYRAMTAWHAALAERVAAGETVDLAAEAAEMGFTYESLPDLRTADEWQKLDRPWVGRNLTDQLLAGEPGALTPAPVVEAKAMLIARTLQKVAEREPTFEEVRDEVAEEWAKDRAAEIASDKLEELRGEFGERPPEGDPTPFRPEATAERFAEVAKEHGYDVHTRDWLDRYQRPGDNPKPEELFFLSNAKLYQLREGAVAEPGWDRDKTHTYLARIAGVRDPENVQMKIAEIEAMEREASQEAVSGFAARTFGSRAFLQEHYGVWLKPWEEAPPETPSGTPPGTPSGTPSGTPTEGQ
jgi:hypothetical protein